MSRWLRPDLSILRQVVRSSHGRLLVCSPFISRSLLEIVADDLPSGIGSVEVWTKLDLRDWLVGASEPDALPDFAEALLPNVESVEIRSGRPLHAKTVISDGPQALAGSANLTRGGFFRNYELARIVDSHDEVVQLRTTLDTIRPRLRVVTPEELATFVGACHAKVESQEALLELIRGELPPEAGTRGGLVAYSEFWQFLDDSDSPVAAQILTIAKNLDRNNNTGKVKQAYFGIQRFLQEYPQHLAFAAALDETEWFDVHDSAIEADWVAFLSSHENESDEDHRYSIATLRRYLTPSSGGTRRGGGGGDNELKRLWPFVGRAMLRRQQ